MLMWYIKTDLKIFKFFLEFLVYSQKMDMKSANIIVSNIINVTKAPHVPKQDMWTKCEFASKQWNICSKTRHAPKKQWKVRKWNKESWKIEDYPLEKV